MIKIEEKTPKRIPGKSALFVSFDYKPEIVSIVKTCTPLNFDKKTKVVKAIDLADYGGL